MTANGAIENFEIERKYEVAAEAALPDAEAFATIGLRSGPAELFELRASYFDTPDGALAAKRIALRRRIGGNDGGWHLKFKSDEGARELMWPQSDDMPEGLLRELADHVGIETAGRLIIIALLETQRMTLLLLDEEKTPVIELADDRVTAHNQLSGRRQLWREWETELMQGVDVEILDHIEPLLLSAGSVRVHDTSKIQRTMSAEA